MLKRTSGKQLIVNPDRIENSQQCQATTRYGIRCKNYTRRSAYCQPHLMQLRNLRIRKTNMVTTRDIPPRTEICVPYGRAY